MEKDSQKNILSSIGIILVRIDDRLIHGQVVVGWVRQYKINQIIVSDDRAAKDSLQKNLMEMAVADSEMEVSVLTTEETADWILKKRFESRRSILLMSSPGEALRLLKIGVGLSVLNIGNLRYTDGCKQLTESVFVNREGLLNFKELNQLGIRLEYQAAPDDAVVDLAQRLTPKLK